MDREYIIAGFRIRLEQADRLFVRPVSYTHLFRGYADLEINDAFPSMLRRFDRAMDKIVTIQSRNMLCKRRFPKRRGTCCP